MESVILSAPTTLSMSNLSTVREFEITNYNTLSTLVIDNVDQSSAINSKSLVDNAVNLANY
jgi:hypothetical protein